jgi:hypothetical protein
MLKSMERVVVDEDPDGALSRQKVGGVVDRVVESLPRPRGMVGTRMTGVR